jgi:hypothetical protein
MHPFVRRRALRPPRRGKKPTARSVLPAADKLRGCRAERTPLSQFSESEKKARAPSVRPSICGTWSDGTRSGLPPLRQLGVDEIYRGKKGKVLSVVCNLETAEPLWFGRERKKETLNDFFRSQLDSR